MVLSELAVTGLRCIEHAELEIAAGLARVWGDTGSGETTLSEAMLLPDRGRLSFIRSSSGLKQLEQDHLRVISASLALLGIQARALRSAGTHHGACLPGTACVARLRGSNHGFRHGGAESRARLGSPPCQTVAIDERVWLSRSRASGLRPIKALPLGNGYHLGRGDLSCARSDGITGFAARGVPGLEKRHSPAIRVPDSGWRHLGAKPRPRCLGALALDRLAATAPWPDACAPVAARLRADASRRQTPRALRRSEAPQS